MDGRKPASSSRSPSDPGKQRRLARDADIFLTVALFGGLALFASLTLLLLDLSLNSPLPLQ